MRPNKPHDGPRRHRHRPGFEGLEFRDLPSSEPLGPALPGRHTPAADVQQFVPVLYPPGTPQPTPAEVARESFVGTAIGRYVVGSGRFGNQSLTITGSGKPASTNQSQGSHFQYVLFEPSASAQNQSLTGVMHFFVKNFLASGASLILDLQGPVGSEVNVGGVRLPTHALWVHDPTSGTTYTGTGTGIVSRDPTIGATYGNFSAGQNNNYFNSTGAPANPPPGSPGGAAPTNVDNWNLGFGDATFKYVPDKHPEHGTLGSGEVILVFRGLINYSGAQNAPDKNFM